MLLVLVGVYPLITVLSYLIAPFTTNWALWQRTALLSPLMVFAMLYGLPPAINKAIRRFERPDQAQTPERIKQ